MDSNVLSKQNSLYLKQHSDNPIHWQIYSAEILETAKKMGKPVFISIGYSSCHWCHVMAHESFSDKKIADFINKNFVAIKVDREEFPDVDQLYQKVSGVLSGRGGWPLNVFLTSDLKPYFIGTYFPLESRSGIPSFMEVMTHLIDLHKNQKDNLNTEGEKILEELKQFRHLEKRVKFEGHFPPPSAILNALSNFQDKEAGGYGEPPKFPHFAFLEWASEQILEGMIPREQGEHIVKTMELMMMGGTYDHVRGGIHRYSTDKFWLVPHFEKMLYDQAGLLRVLSKMTHFYPSPLFFDAIIQTLDYLEREMLSEDGYFMSAQDADSEGHEGWYFTFSLEEFRQTLRDASDVLGPYQEKWEQWFNQKEKGNFEGDLNVISLAPQLKEGYYDQNGWEEIRKIRQALLDQRKQRIPPATDSKGVASWNFMILSALCDVVQHSKVPQIASQAIELLNNIIERLPNNFIIIDKEKHVIKHVTTQASTRLYLEDYVTFAHSMFRLYEVTGLDTFLMNAKETIAFIKREFMQEHQCFISHLSSSVTQNLPANLNDESFRSPLATLLLLTSRSSLLWPEFETKEFWGQEWDELIQLTLTNPIAHGEALRAFTYPLNLIRKLEVPKKWINEPKFQELRSHLFSRFVLCYHEKENEHWEICHRTACELSGDSLEKLMAVFYPAKNKTNENS